MSGAAPLLGAFYSRYEPQVRGIDALTRSLLQSNGRRTFGSSLDRRIDALQVPVGLSP
jgi:hypothetical protein